jgi:hypothetical protein
VEILTPKQRRKHSSLFAQASKLKQAEKLDHRRYISMPKALREPSAFVLYGCASIADLYVQDGMDWKAVQKVQKYARAAREKRKGVVLEEGVGRESFAMTRLHNGPGLMDFRRPRVRIPLVRGGELKMEREVSCGVNLVGVGMLRWCRRRIVRGCLGRRCVFDFRHAELEVKICIASRSSRSRYVTLNRCVSFWG